MENVQSAQEQTTDTDDAQENAERRVRFKNILVKGMSTIPEDLRDEVAVAVMDIIDGYGESICAAHDKFFGTLHVFEELISARIDALSDDAKGELHNVFAHQLPRLLAESTILNLRPAMEHLICEHTSADRVLLHVVQHYCADEVRSIVTDFLARCGSPEHKSPDTSKN